MFNFQDDYIFQRLGYQAEAKKLKNFSADEIKANRANLESISPRNVTEQDLKDFTTYRKLNPYKGGGLLAYIVFLGILISFDVWLVKATIYVYTYQATPASDILKTPYYILPLAVLMGQIFTFKSRPKRKKETTPQAVIDAFLVSVFKTGDSMEGKSSETSEAFYLDLFVPTETCFLYQIEAQSDFKYTDNQTHIWSDFVYTPVKIFLFPGYDYLIVPPFSAKKGSSLLHN